MQQKLQGFTLIEIIVSIALLALVMTAVLAPMLGLFGFSRSNEDILDINTLAQQRLEEARAEVQSNYEDPALFRARLESLDVSCQNIGLYGAVMNNSCYDTLAVPPLRRLSLVAEQNGKSIVATVDVTE